MNSQRMTDSNDGSNAVTVHTSKHSQVPDRERDRELEGLRGVKKMSKKISSSFPGRKYKLKIALHLVLITTYNHIFFKNGKNKNKKCNRTHTLTYLQLVSGF